jgi:PAS domain S-box-containing protein
VNDAAVERYGYSRSELEGLRLADLAPEEERQELEGRLRAAGEGVTHLASRQRTKDGRELEVEMTIRPLRQRLGRTLVCAVRDVTAARETELALRESEARQRRAVEDAPFPIMIHAEDGEVLVVNRTWRELTGYDDGEVRTIHDWTARINVEGHEKDREAFAELFGATGRVTEGIHTVTSRDGSRRLWDFSSSPLGTLADGRRIVMSIAADLTERIKASAERDLLMTAIEQLGETVLITDADGTIEYVNSAFEETTGYGRDEAAGRSPRLVKSGEHDAAFYDDLWSTISSGRTWQGQVRNRRKDGTLFTEETTISPVRDESGAIRHYVAVKNDITARLDLEEQVRQGSKMESIGLLAGGVAHDFNNMLTVILGHAELALDRVEPSTPVHDGLVEIRQAAQRSAELTRQLLAFARRQVVQPTPLCLNDRVGSTLRMLRRLIGEDIELAWRPEDGLEDVRIDPGQVDQILANLCVNARDSIDGVGRMTIETHNVTLDEAYGRAHAGVEPGRYVVLAVTDDGRGMDRETRRRIFEPYFTTKATGKGTGLGLATVYGIVQQNQGFIHVYSEPGEGATFRIYLPVCAPCEERPADEGKRSIPQGRGETVLLVEDQPPILELGTEMLRLLGYSVLPVGEPAAALRIAGEGATAIDLLITDVIMPEMNGAQLVEGFRALRPDTPCLYMSGYTADAIAQRGLTEEGVHFLQKPFLLEDLAVKVRTAVDSASGVVAVA